MFDKTLGLESDVSYKLIMTLDHVNTLSSLFHKLLEHRKKKGYVRNFSLDDDEIDLITDYMQMVEEGFKENKKDDREKRGTVLD